MNLPIGHFGLKKTSKLVAQKYYWLILRHNIDNYVKGYNKCRALKAI